MEIDNQSLYDKNWGFWIDQKVYGPASRWLRYLIDDLLDAIPDPAKIGAILDLGCGEGTNTYFIARRFVWAKVRGIDFSKTGIACAQSRYRLPNLEFICDPDSRILDGRYDLITCFEVLEHVEQWQELLARMITAAERYLMLSFPTGRMRAYEKNVGHVQNFQKQEMENYLLKLGFQPLRVFYSGFPFYSPFYRELCNFTNAANCSLTQGAFGTSQKIVSAILFILFRYFSTKKRSGDQFCGIFEKTV